MKDVVDRFWSKVDRSGGRDACWPWTGGHNKETGYGIFHPGRNNDYPLTVTAHRFAASLAGIIDISDSTQHVDHACHNGTGCPPGPCAHRLCCNPGHHARATNSENVNNSHNANKWKTHCPQNHEYTPENTRTQVKGNTISRKCMTCERASYVPHPLDSPIDATAVIEQYESGAGATAIAASMGRSLARINRVLDDAQIKRRGPGRVPNRKEVA